MRESTEGMKEQEISWKESRSCLTKNYRKRINGKGLSDKGRLTRILPNRSRKGKGRRFMTQSKITRGVGPQAPDLPGRTAFGVRVGDQEEINVYVRIGYRKRKIRLLILKSIGDIMDIGRRKEEDVSGTIKEFRRHIKDLVEDQIDYAQRPEHCKQG